MIETERLVLRPPAMDDLGWILAHINTPEVLRHLGGRPRSEQDVAAGLEADIAAFANGGHRRWTIWSRQGQRRVGRCGLSRVRSEVAPEPLRGQPEIGWTLAEDSRGKGYATEAARAVLAFAFETLGHPVVYAQTSDSNAGSTRMMQRLALTRRPELDYVDPDYPSCDNPTTVWSQDAADWKATLA